MGMGRADTNFSFDGVFTQPLSLSHLHALLAHIDGRRPKRTLPSAMLYAVPSTAKKQKESPLRTAAGDS